MKIRHSTEEDLFIQRLSIDGQSARTAIRKGRTGGTPLLLLNGIGGCFEMLLPFVDAYADTDVILLDMPGAGKSPPPTFPWRFRDYAKFTRKVVDKLGIDTVIVMGISWGGVLAQQFAKMYPERCEHLILSATAPGCLLLPPSPKVLYLMSNPRRYYDKAFLKRVAGTIYGGKLRTNKLSAGNFAALMAPPSKRGYYYQMLAVWGWTSLPWLSKIQTPTLVLHGNDDPIIPLVNAKTMARLIPGAEFEVLDCGHLFMLTRANRTVKYIRDFVANTPRSEACGVLVEA